MSKRKPLEITPSTSSFTVYTPPAPKRPRALKPIDLVVIVVGASAILFGIHPFFEMVAWLGPWLCGQ